MSVWLTLTKEERVGIQSARATGRAGLGLAVFSRPATAAGGNLHEIRLSQLAVFLLSGRSGQYPDSS